MKHKNIQLGLTEIHLKVLGLFTNGFDKSYYVREVSKILFIGPRTAQLALEGLEKKGVLESTLRGKIKIYELRENGYVNDYLLLAETFKKIVFLNSHKIIAEIISKISPYINGIGIIFGSYAKGFERKDSDLDIFIIGSYNAEEIDNISDIYKIKISLKNYPLNSFKKYINEDILIKEVLNNHIVFKNAEQLIQIAMEKNGKP